MTTPARRLAAPAVVLVGLLLVAVLLVRSGDGLLEPASQLARAVCLPFTTWPLLLMLTRARRAPVVRATWWRLLRVGYLLLYVGVLLRDFPLIPDPATGGVLAQVCYTGGAAGLLAAGALLELNQGSRLNLGIVIDAAVLDVALLTGAWCLVQPSVTSTALGQGAVFAILSACIGLMLTGILLAAAAAGHLKMGSTLSAALAALAYAAGCLVALVVAPEGTAPLGSYLLWTLAAVLLGVMCLHVLRGEGLREDDVRSPRWRPLSTAVAGGLPLVIYAVQLCRPSTHLLVPDAVVLAGCLCLVCVGCVVRVDRAVVQATTQRRKLATLARSDHLTGLANRRTGEHELAAALARGAKGDESVTVAVIDLDHFKDFNDRYGHHAGDELLIGAANAWSLCLGAGQTMARYGGEEFLVVATGLAPSGLAEVVDRMREATPRGQSFSAGIATWDGLEDAHSLVARADGALYEAKANGRARTRLAYTPVCAQQARRAETTSAPTEPTELARPDPAAPDAGRGASATGPGAGWPGTLSALETGVEATPAPVGVPAAPVAGSPAEAAPTARRSRTRVGLQVFIVYLALCVGGLVIVIGARSHLVRDCALAAVGLLTPTATVFAIRWYRPRHAWVWLLVAGSELCWGLGIILDPRSSVHPGDLPISLAELLATVGYSLTIGAVFSLVRLSDRRRRSLTNLDITVVLIAVLAAVWVGNGTPVLGEVTHVSSYALVVFPIADLLIALAVVLLAARSTIIRPGYVLALAGASLLLVCDVIARREATVPHGPLSGIAQFLTLACLGLAPLHPSMRYVTEAGMGWLGEIGRVRVLVLGLALLTPAALLLAVGPDAPAVTATVLVVSAAVSLAVVLARLAGIVRVVEDQGELLDGQARSDHLTGLPNRRTVDAELERSLLDAAERDEPLVVGLLDLDNFKAYNDERGHAAGDRLLTATAALWRSELPADVFVGRYGGEEFVVVVRGRSLREIADLVDGTRGRMPNGVGFSAGFAEWDGVEGARVLLGRADRALYAAKDAGRAASWFSPVPGAPPQPARSADRVLATASP